MTSDCSRRKKTDVLSFRRKSSHEPIKKMVQGRREFYFLFRSRLRAKGIETIAIMWCITLTGFL